MNAAVVEEETTRSAEETRLEDDESWLQILIAFQVPAALIIKPIR